MVVSKLLQLQREVWKACYITMEAILKLQANLLQIKNSGEESQLCVPKHLG